MDFGDAGKREVFNRGSTVDVKTRADVALAESSSSMVGHSFWAVMKLKNGGVLLELDSEEAVECSTQAR